MNPFYMLSPSMQRKVWGMGWDSFTPIQEMAIPAIAGTQKDAVLSSATASGKTEAAFLPILSLVEKTAPSQLNVLYISPLKALINNQFERVEMLCAGLDIPIHRWHGDVDQGKKAKLTKSPAGILQITPESVESLFVNRTEHLPRLLENLRFVVIDEIHSFLNGERGVQLRSLIARMGEYAKERPRIVGLSATIDSFDFVKSWVNPANPENVEIVEAKDSDKALYYSLMHFPLGEDNLTPVDMFEDIRELTREQQSMIFCNSRGEVEEATVFLNRFAEREGVGETYYAHHSSIDKKEREYVEKTLSSASSPKSVVCTSSLELGIDIGQTDLVVQVDSTYTVSSLKQRLGRSGRKQDASQYLQLYATTDDSLLQSLAVTDLLLDKWIEPAEGYEAPYDILFHQILSICHQKNGLTEEALLARISQNGAFSSLPENAVRLLIAHMRENDHLELIRGKNELIVGVAGERILRAKDFYAVFMSAEEYIVQAGGKKIGQLDYAFARMLEPGDKIILAGRPWLIAALDHQKLKVHVEKTAGAKKPKFNSPGNKIHQHLGDRMMQILCSTAGFAYLNEDGAKALSDLRKPYALRNIKPLERALWEHRDGVLFEPFTGTKIINTIRWMLRASGVGAGKCDRLGRFLIEKRPDLTALFASIGKKDWKPQEILPFVDESEWFASKFMEHLPPQLRALMHAKNEMDIAGARAFLSGKRFRYFPLS